MAKLSPKKREGGFNRWPIESWTTPRGRLAPYTSLTFLLARALHPSCSPVSCGPPVSRAARSRPTVLQPREHLGACVKSVVLEPATTSVR
jgi:hypothetical protein